MSLIDRYIARQYFINCVLLLLILFAFVVAVDASLQLGRFVRLGTELASENDREPTLVRRFVVTVMLVANLWWPRLLQLFNYMIGFVLIGGMGFTLTQMVRHRELVALLASGRSLVQVARPILLVGLFFTFLQVLNMELIIPRIAPLLLRGHSEAAERSLGETTIPLTPDSSGRLWMAQEFDADTGEIRGLTVWERNEQKQPSLRVSADSARWRDGGWDLIGGQFVVPSVAAIELVPEPISRIETDLSPTRLRIQRYRGYSQSLSYLQTTRLLNDIPDMDPRAKERIERVRFGRFGAMLANLLALIVAMPFYLCRVPTNMLVQSLKCAPVALGAVVGGVLGSAAAIPGVPAQLGVFLPAMVLLPMGVAVFTGLRT